MSSSSQQRRDGCGRQRREDQARRVGRELVVAAVEAKVQRDRPIPARARMKEVPVYCIPGTQTSFFRGVPKAIPLARLVS